MQNPFFIDSISCLEPKPRLTSAEHESIKKLVSKWSDKLKDVEMFLFESPYNNYYPKPNKGEFALRSHKRRLFFLLERGNIPKNIDLNKAIREEILLKS